MTSSTDLSGQIQKLLAEKQHHTEALGRIDETLEKVGLLLGLSTEIVARRGRGRPRKTQPAAQPVAVQVDTPQKHIDRRLRFSITAQQSILDFVSKSGSPTTMHVNQHWKAEGRVGTAYQTLHLMVKKKTIQRVPIEGTRANRYVVG